MLDPKPLAALLDRLETLTEREAAQVKDALIEEARDACARDGMEWLRYVQTRDEADPQAPVKPFPVHLPYVRQLWADYLAHPMVAVAKSRQMIVSWETCAFCVWWARSKPHQSLYWQAQAWPDVVRMIAMPKGGFTGRMQFIESHLPGWLQQPVTASEGRLQYPENESMIQGLAGGADQVRGQTFSLYVGDEFARMEEQEGVYTTIGPLLQKGARAILISTPNGTANTFATVWHGRPVDMGGLAA